VIVIRFQRSGRKKRPFYRIVVAEKSKPVGGKFLEKLGYFDPVLKNFSFKKERIEHWISVGAIPSQTAARLFAKNDISVAEKFIKERENKPTKAEREKAEADKKAAEEKIKADKEKAAQKEKEAEKSEEKVENKEEKEKEEKKDDSNNKK